MHSFIKARSKHSATASDATRRGRAREISSARFRGTQGAVPRPCLCSARVRVIIFICFELSAVIQPHCLLLHGPDHPLTSLMVPLTLASYRARRGRRVRGPSECTSKRASEVSVSCASGLSKSRQGGEQGTVHFSHELGPSKITRGTRGMGQHRSRGYAG